MDYIVESSGITWVEFGEILAGTKEPEEIYLKVKKEEKGNQILEDTKILSEQRLILSISVSKID